MKRFSRCVVVVLAVTLLSAADKTNGIQTQIPEEAANAAQQSATPGQGGSVHEMVTALYVFGTGLLIFCAAFIGLVAWVAFRSGKSWKDDLWSTRIIVLAMVIGVGGFLTIAGYSTSQAAPMYSILGGIVGYIFGEAKGANPKQEE